MDSPCDLLIVAAFLPELIGLDALVDEAEGRAGKVAVLVRPVGIGLVAAATGTASRLEAVKPRAVVLVGTCGAYPGSKLRVNDVVVARTITLVDSAVLAGRAAMPEPMSAELQAHAAMSAALAASGAPRADVATTLAVTTDDALAASLARATGAAVEHLEAFAVASACAAYNVPFSAALGVANEVGSKGRAEWRAGHVQASAAAVGFVARWVRAGAAGVPHR